MNVITSNNIDEIYSDTTPDTFQIKDIAESIKIMAENAKKDSVVTLPSGLQYKIIKEGTGEKPKADSKVEVNYEGRLIDGTVFDSSYKRNKPQEFSVSGVVPGFSEALQHMTVGSTWEVYIPQELAYGSRETRNSPIKPFSALIFKIDTNSPLPQRGRGLFLIS